MSRLFFCAFLICLFASPTRIRAEQLASEVTQHGITWTFDKPYPVGRFITGDWWVVGPVRVFKVDPAPGPANEGPQTDGVETKYGTPALRADGQMRNGSMIILEPNSRQGYDSRLRNYEPSLSLRFPLTLENQRSLVSTISNEKFPSTLLHDAIMWRSEKTGNPALESAAVLTCLDKAPPADAFRPPFAGTFKPLHRWQDLRWDLLPKLKPAGKTPDWEIFARYYERPWLDHVTHWVYQYMGPRLNQVNYGREANRIGGIAGLMLMLDVSREKKEPLMRGFVQHGIDLGGLAKAGRVWAADGGHFNGRKWPMLFAGLMLGDDAMLAQVRDGDFSEDRQTYYGKGWFGQTALFQIGVFAGAQPTYEETPPAEWGGDEKRQESYRYSTISGGWPGTALAVQLMGAKALWNHDAFFDYADRWMRKDDPYAAARQDLPRPKQEGGTPDPFVDAMWAAYREKIPAQADAGDPVKWTWNPDRKTGKYLPNPKK